MIEIADLVDAGATVVGPVRARRFSGFAAEPETLAPDSVYLHLRGKDPYAAARACAAAAVLSASPLVGDRWSVTTLYVDDISSVLARWILAVAARHRIAISIVGPRRNPGSAASPTRQQMMMMESVAGGLSRAMVSLVDLTGTTHRGDLVEALASLANAVAMRGLGLDRVEVLANVDTARSLAEALGAGEAVLTATDSEVDLVCRWDGDLWWTGNLAPSAERAPAFTADDITATSAGDDPSASTIVPVDPRPPRALAWARVSAERATWVSLDLDAVAANVRAIRSLLGPSVDVMAVIKANAYGHGSAAISRTALAAGACALGVAALSEAITLRDGGIDAPILVLGYTPPWQADEVVRHDVSISVASLDVVEAVGRAATRQARAGAKVHVKVDTGMGRLGMPAEQAFGFARDASRIQGVQVEGIFTHFATADWADQTYAREQLERFQVLLRQLHAEGMRPRVVHAANTAAMLTLPEARFDMVRLGIGMYGLNPSLEVACPAGFRPALRFTTTIAQVKNLPAGHGVSYGRTFVTARPTRIAVLPVGYGDGFRRSPRNWGSVLIHGELAPIVGVVCMDMCMVDVTHIPGVEAGDEVVLLGEQGRRRLTADDIAERLGTINYEVVTQILARVPREAWTVSSRAPADSA